jgi:hypothetical protein
MLETIRQFAEEQLAARGEADEVRAAHARHFAARESDILALWDGPRQRESYEWFTVELANLRAAFRWSADHSDLDAAAAIAFYAAFLGVWVEQYEPVGWAEELIESARAQQHRRLAQLYVMAAHCYAAGRIDDGVGYAEAARITMGSGRFDKVTDVAEVSLGAAYVTKGEPELMVEACRSMVARHPDSYCYARALLAMALTVAGAHDEAEAASEGLLAATDATDNPHTVSFALNATGNSILSPRMKHSVVA